MIDLNKHDIPYNEDTKGPPDLINTEGTHEQNVQNDQMITQTINVPSGNDTEVSGSITKSLVPNVTQTHISNQASISSHLVPHDRWSRDQHIELVNIIGDLGKGMLTRSMAAKLMAASTSEYLFADFLPKIEPKKVSECHISNQASASSYLVPQDRWSRDQHIKLVNIIGDPGEGMLKRSMATKLTAASGSECLFADFLFAIEPKKVSEALKYPGWVDAMNKKDEHGITTKNKARLVSQGYSHEEGINYDETFAPIERIEAIRIFLAFATYMNFKVYQMDVKNDILNSKLKEEVYVKQPPGIKSSEFPNYVCKLDKAFYGLKQAPKACPMCKISVQSKRITSNSCEKNSQSAKKQQAMAMSSVEAEYVTVAGCCAMSSLHLTAKPKKGKSQTVTPTLSKSQGLEAFGALSKKSKRPMVLRDKDLGANILLADMELIHPTVVDLLGTGAKYQAARIAKAHHQSPPPQEDKSQSSHAPSIEASDTDSSSDNILNKYDSTLPLTKIQFVKYLRKVLNVMFTMITEDNWEKHEEVAVNYVVLKASIDEYYDVYIAHRDQTDKLVEASMSSLNKSSNIINDLYKGLNIITELLKEIKNTVKDDSVINKKISKATESFTKFSINITKL
nr:retrovirus-related Pol polyprotein from transposon TNT 1-94 [Tanacetum cinerariifolium]